MQHFIDAYHDELTARGRTRVHIVKTIGHLRRFSLFTGVAHPTQIDRFAPGAWLAAQRQRGLSTASINSMIASLKAWGRWLVDMEAVDRSPFAHLHKQSVDGDRRHERRALTDDEIHRLVEAAGSSTRGFRMPGPCRALCYRTAIETGLRVSELRSLTVAQLDTRNRMIHVRGGATKNRRSASCPISRALADDLRDWFADSLPTMQAFPMPSGHAAAMLRADLTDADIPYRDDHGRVADFHALRHTTATRCATHNIPMAATQRVMRHSTIDLTARYYVHIENYYLQQQLDSLPPVV